jgi:dynein heavy chain
MAAPMTERHRWMAANVAAAFDMIDTQNVVEDVLTEYNNFKKINDFLEGRAKHKHLFIYYQKPDIFNDAGEFVDAKGDAKLFITYGDNDDLRIKSRAVYFLRTVGDQKAVKPEVACDHELLFGEVAAAPLESLATGLNDVFRPLFAHAANTAQDKSCIDWSNVDEEQRTEFLTGFSKFTFDLTEGIRTLSDGIELGVLPVGDVDWRTMSYQDISTDHEDIVKQCEDLLDQWCSSIERYLEETLEGQKEAGDPGPRTELEFWRNRLQKITSITDQLKTKERRVVFGVLQAMTRNPPDVQVKSRQTVLNELRRWKQVDIAITEAFNEAKDNVKYLTTLEKFLEPLYYGTPTAVIDSLPALMNAVKMIYTIARYYNTTDRMTNLFAKITNQMISNCKNCVMRVPIMSCGRRTHQL